MKLKNFADHINEAYNPNDERYLKLKSLGLTEEPTLDDRIDGLQADWDSNPRIGELITELENIARPLINKWFPTDSTDTVAIDHYMQYIERIGDLGSYDTGILEVMVTNSYD
jgi:hypothetical protein